MIRRAHKDPTHDKNHPYDELALEISNRKMLLGGFEDIYHKYPDLREIENKNEESGTETETSDSELEQEEDQDSNEETDQDSASDEQRVEQEQAGKI